MKFLTRRIRPDVLSVLLFAVLGRLALLEYTDLTDPTESRYSIVALEMVRSGNWLTPSLPMPEGVVPYLGKPPLHFWLTAISYNLLGFDEWTSRLPSFMGTILLAVGVFFFVKKFFGRIEAWAAALVFLSSGMTYVLAGASVTDVTLALMVTSATIFLYSFVSSRSPAWQSYLAALFAGLGFMVKGPVAVVLIGLPFLLWSIFSRDFSWMRRLPWVRSILIFLAVVVPWFVLNELKNPGFIQYFVWNENIARYLFKDYGDRYGSGHSHPHGTSWFYLAVAYLPWTLVLIFTLARLGREQALSIFRTDRTLLFLACWSLIPPVFFTFVRQLHMLYIYPAVAPLSILTAVLLVRHGELFAPLQRLTLRYGAHALVLIVAIGSLIFGATKGFSQYSLPLTAAVLILTLSMLIYRSSKRDALGYIATTSLIVFSLHLLVLINLTPWLNSKNSSEEALLAAASDDSCNNSTKETIVGILTQNTFSHYWTAGAWRSELPEKVTIKYVAAQDIPRTDICYFLVEANAKADLIKALSRDYSVRSRSAGWLVYARNQQTSG